MACCCEQLLWLRLPLSQLLKAQSFMQHSGSLPLLPTVRRSPPGNRPQGAKAAAEVETTHFGKHECSWSASKFARRRLKRCRQQGGCRVNASIVESPSHSDKRSSDADSDRRLSTHADEPFYLTDDFINEVAAELAGAPDTNSCSSCTTEALLLPTRGARLKGRKREVQRAALCLQPSVKVTAQHDRLCSWLRFLA